MHSSGPDPWVNQDRLLKYKPFMDHNFITTDTSILKREIKDIKNLHFFFVPVDKNCIPLRPAITWLDERCSKEVVSLSKKIILQFQFMCLCIFFPQLLS